MEDSIAKDQISSDDGIDARLRNRKASEQSGAGRSRVNQGEQGVVGEGDRESYDKKNCTVIISESVKERRVVSVDL